MRGSLKKALMANLNAQMFGDTDEKILMSSYYVHGVLKAGILEWVAISFYREFSCIDRLILSC